MTGMMLLAIACAAGAAWAWLSGFPGDALARAAPPPPLGPPPSGTEPERSGLRWARAASLLVGIALAVLIGGVTGVAIGVGAALGLPRALARLELASSRRERLALVRSAPLVADLLAASLSAGAPVDRCLPVVARAVGHPAEGLLLAVHRRISLGEPADRAWRALAVTPGLGGIATTVARSSRTGAPLAALLASTAQDLRDSATAAALAEVRATSVRAVLPLGLCLLPAFALLGIVPVVGGLLPSL